MTRLVSFLTIALTVWTAPAAIYSEPQAESIKETVQKIAKEVGVPPTLMQAICRYESAGFHNLITPDDGEDDTSSFGICQIKEGTAREVGFHGPAYVGPTRPSLKFKGHLEPAGPLNGLMKYTVNAYFAARYLKTKLEQYDGDWCKATSAYNAGRFRESKKSPGKPRNYKYIKRITLLLDEEHKDFLVCGPRKVSPKPHAELI